MFFNQLGLGPLATVVGTEIVPEKGCFAFFKLVDHVKPAVVASGAPALCKAAMERFPENADLQKYGREVLK